MMQILRAFSISNNRFQNVGGILIFVSVVFLAASCGTGPKSEIINQQSNQRTQIQVSHKVDGVDSGDQLFNFYADENKTALDLLRSGHNVETKAFSGVGEFVESINGKKAESTKEFWALYVNDKQSSVGASDYKPKNGDKIEWKLEKIK